MEKELKSAREELSETKDGAMWVAMFDVNVLLNRSEIARTYFQKDVNWFNQRLHGYRVNGKPAKFKKEELRVLSGALKDIARKVLVASEKVDAMIEKD